MLPDLAAIRAEFPSITGAQATGDLFLDAAGGSQAPRIVAERIAEYLTTINVQLGAGTASSKASGARVESAHRWLETWLGASEDRAASDRHVAIIGSSASSLCAMVANAVARSPVAGRDEIVVGLAGHESNLGPWTRLATLGLTPRWWGADRTSGESSIEELRDLVTERTRIVAVHHVSNITGEIEDLEEIVAIAHARGAHVVADGVAFAPHRAMEVDRWGVDAYFFSLYKVFGPELAALAATPSFLATLEAPNHDFIAPAEIPAAFELGGASRSGCVGALAVAEYFAMLAGAPPPSGEGVSRAVVEAAYARIEQLEAPLTERVLEDLARRPAVRVIGPGEMGSSRLPTISFVVEGASSKEIAARAGARGLGIRAGHFYAQRLTSHLGLDPADGVVRISLAHTNHPDELDRFEEFLDEVAPRA